MTQHRDLKIVSESIYKLRKKINDKFLVNLLKIFPNKYISLTECSVKKISRNSHKVTFEDKSISYMPFRMLISCFKQVSKGL